MLEILQTVGNWLLAIPAPTEHWASIINSLAWPSVVVFLVYRFRRYLRVFLDTIARRLQTDHVKLGPFEFTPNSEVLVLDPSEAAESTQEYSPEDTVRIEHIFEFIADDENWDRLEEWLNQNVSGRLAIADFVTDPTYANERERAYIELQIGDQ